MKWWDPSSQWSQLRSFWSCFPGSFHPSWCTWSWNPISETDLALWNTSSITPAWSETPKRMKDRKVSVCARFSQHSFWDSLRPLSASPSNTWLSSTSLPWQVWWILSWSLLHSRLLSSLITYTAITSSKTKWRAPTAKSSRRPTKDTWNKPFISGNRATVRTLKWTFYRQVDRWAPEKMAWKEAQDFRRTQGVHNMACNLWGLSRSLSGCFMWAGTTTSCPSSLYTSPSRSIMISMTCILTVKRDWCESLNVENIIFTNYYM